MNALSLIAGLFAAQVALDMTWAKWERVTGDRKWLAKTLWALLKLRCDARFPEHQLLPTLNSTLQAIQQQQQQGQGQ